MSRNEYKNLKILYVEDEELIRKNAVSYLNRLFNNVLEASNAIEAMQIINKERPHVVITDIKMPKLNGLDMVRKIRQSDKNTQFIVLSAFTDTKYLLDAIDLGLVKYLPKPIRHEVIYPLLMSCAKLVFDNNDNKKYFNEKCYFDMASELLIDNGKSIKLAKNEQAFLRLLCKKSPRAVSYEELQNFVWGEEYMSENAIRLLVRDLRKKLPEDTIKNISKIGYKID
ncbi:DNA-binding response regulator [Halarcobacter ebronensis]|uniref:DNA-binding response regulator n=1 Tax=Halarcobacter ebronensis TaxID=1462615 RepID=A0A4Q0YEM9_9BACT|nr:response regulator transcription factor [Halarcobacter ebronensis]RXJ68912.1 DNA-binding response regulator [Halarcobacter ebronensis]